MIKLDSDTYYQLARQAVLDEDFDKALGYFIKSDDYHSKLNSIVLLLYFGDLSLAHQQYLQLYAKYKDTHNVNNDVKLAMRGTKKGMLNKFFVGKSQRRDANKISASKNKLFSFAYFVGCGNADDIVDELGQMVQDVGAVSQAMPTRFAVVGSNEYFDLLIEKMSAYYFDGELEKGRKYLNLLMDADSDYVIHLQLKLMLLLAHGKVQQAEELSLRLMNHPDLTQQGKFAIADVLYMQGKKQQLRQFLQTTSWNHQFDDVEHRKLVALATYAEDYELANKFASMMATDECPNVNLDYLITASIAYYNNGQLDLALNLARRVLSTLPNNVAVKALIAYYNMHKDGVTKLNVAQPQAMFTPYQMPVAVAKQSLDALLSGYDDKQIAWHLSVLYYYENGCYVGTNQKSFCHQITQFMMQSDLKLSQDALDLIQVALLDRYASPRLKTAFLFYLTKHCQGEYTVFTNAGENQVCSSHFQGVTDAQRLVFCAIAVIHNLKEWDLQKAVQLYNAYDDQMQGHDTFTFAETLISSLTADNQPLA